MVRIQVTLGREEAKRLAQWAESELRDPRDQIRFIVREALQEREAVTQQPRRADGGEAKHGKR